MDCSMEGVNSSDEKVVPILSSNEQASASQQEDSNTDTDMVLDSGNSNHSESSSLLNNGIINNNNDKSDKLQKYENFGIDGKRRGAQQSNIIPQKDSTDKGATLSLAHNKSAESDKLLTSNNMLDPRKLLQRGSSRQLGLDKAAQNLYVGFDDPPAFAEQADQFDDVINENEVKDGDIQKSLLPMIPIAIPPEPSANPFDYEYGWSTEYHKLLDKIQAIQTNGAGDLDEKRKVYRALADLAKDFSNTAKLYGRIIIEETCLDNSKKTIKSINVGGVAGGEKYEVRGIFFKFAHELYGLYGVEENANKVAAHELRSCAAITSLALGDSDIQIYPPLMAIVDFRGHRLLAVSKLPIGKHTIVYGSNDAGTTIHKGKDKEVDDLVSQISAKLNLKKHKVSNEVEIDIGTDCEVHVVGTGSGKRAYIVDLARLYPPECPTSHMPDLKTTLTPIQVEFTKSQRVDDPNSKRMRLNPHLYRQLRPYFVYSFGKPLSSDAFSKFGEIDKHVHDQDVIEATLALRTTAITHLCQSLEENQVWVDDYPAKFSLTEHMHSMGINMRYLYLIYKNLPMESKWRHVVRTEMVARAFKTILREKWRDYSKKKEGRLSEEVYHEEAIVQLNNLLFCLSDIDGNSWDKITQYKVLKQKHEEWWILMSRMVEDKFGFEVNGSYPTLENYYLIDDKSARDMGQGVGTSLKKFNSHSVVTVATDAQQVDNFKETKSLSSAESFKSEDSTTSECEESDYLPPNCLANSVQKELLLQRVCQMLGFELDSSLNPQALKITPKFLLSFDDLKNVVPTVKHLDIISFADAKVLQYKAIDNVDGYNHGIKYLRKALDNLEYYWRKDKGYEWILKELSEISFELGLRLQSEESLIFLKKARDFEQLYSQRRSASRNGASSAALDINSPEHETQILIQRAAGFAAVESRVIKSDLERSYPLSLSSEKYLFVGGSIEGERGKLALFNVKSNQQMWEKEHGSWIRANLVSEQHSLVFFGVNESPDVFALSLTDGEQRMIYKMRESQRYYAPLDMQFYSMMEKDEHHRPGLPRKILGIALMDIPNSQTILFGASFEGAIYMWDMKTGAYIDALIGHEGTVMSLDVDTERNIIASSSSDRTAIIWNIETRQPTRVFGVVGNANEKIGHTGQVTSVTLSRRKICEENELILCTTSFDGTCRIWNGETGICERVLKGHLSGVWRACFIDPSIVVTAGGDESIRVWSVENGKCMKILLGHTDNVYNLAYSPTRELLYSSSADGTVREWKIRNKMDLFC